MSSFDTARELWELEQIKERDKFKEAAEKGDPEAMEMLAYHIDKIEYNCRDKVIELLTAASDAGRATASWKLADLYANWDKKKYHDKIEHYCRLAFASGDTFSDDEPEGIYGSVHSWIEKHHPEWCEMEEGFYDDGRYYLHPTYRYGMNVFRGVGKTAAKEMKRKKQKDEALWNNAKELFEKDKEAGFKAFLELCDAGNPIAAHSLGYYYHYGIAVEKNLETAKKYYELAIERGYQSYSSIGFIYDELGDKDKAFEALLTGAKKNDAYCYSILSEKTAMGQFYGGNSYVAAYLATRAYEMDKAEGDQLGLLYLTGIFFPIVYPYAKYCIENSTTSKAYLEECGYEFPDYWDEIEAIKPRYPKFDLTLYRCKNAKNPEQLRMEGIELMQGDEADKAKGAAKIELAAKCGYCLAMVSAYKYKIDDYEYHLKRGAIECGHIRCIEFLAMLNQEKIRSYYKDNPYLQEAVKLWNLRKKLHGHIGMGYTVSKYYKTFKEKYDAMI